MLDEEFHAYIGLLVFSSLVLSVVAVRGFGLSTGARIVDGAFSVAFLGYAGYLVLAEPSTVLVSYYAFIAPVLAVIHAVRHRRTRRTVEPVHAHGNPSGFYIDPVPAPPPATLAYIERLGGGPVAHAEPGETPTPGGPAAPADPVPPPAAPAQAAPAQAAPPQAAPAQVALAQVGAPAPNAAPGFLPPASSGLQPALAEAAPAAAGQRESGRPVVGRHRRAGS